MASQESEASHFKPLAEAIAVATRSVHTKLNKLIVARLPSALPPRAADPSIYVSGLLHIAPIYITFEALWQNLLSAPPIEVTTNGDDADVARIRSLLEHLRLPGLMRASRLKADIQSMTGLTGPEVEQELTATGASGRLAEFIRHIKRSVESKPHVLLSYSYILYMALFAGGRFIRASLESAGDEFWDQVSSPIRLGLQPSDEHLTRQQSHASHTYPLRFFHFPTAEDGEDLRRDFKLRFSESADRLTPHERHDVVQEAVCIFDNMALLVSQLDAMFGQHNILQDPDVKPGLAPHKHGVLNPKTSRLRDSVVIAKERSGKLSARNTSSDEIERSPPDGRKQQPEIGTYEQDSEKHPHTSDVAKIKAVLCPGMAKTVRFQSVSQPCKDEPTVHSSRSEPSSVHRMVYQSIGGLQAANWILVVAFGIIFLGAYLTSGRTVPNPAAEALQ